MPELMLSPPMQAGIASNPLAMVPRAKDDMEKYASILREINHFANSDVGKQLLTPIIQKMTAQSKGPNGSVSAAEGDHKPMPIENTPTSPFFNGDQPGKRVGSAQRVQTIVEVKEVPTPMPVELGAAQQVEMFIAGLQALTERVGKEKTLMEAMEWVINNKTLIVTFTKPLVIQPK